ncbi:MAG: hypothetical protein IJU20_01870 [Clostridia bacterium]|nr:hypothetical protein [Clostridia bacterium]
MKKALAFTLAVLMVLALFASCGQKDDKPEGQTDSEKQTQEQSTVLETETKKVEIVPTVVNEKYPDQSFDVLHWWFGEVGDSWIPWEEVHVTDMTGDTMGDLIYYRSSYVTDHFKTEMSVTYENAENLGNLVKTLVNGGSKEYDLVIQRGVRLGKIYMDDLFTDLNEIPSVDFTYPWWSTDAVTSMAWGKQNFFAVSDMLYLDKGASACVYYNAEIAENHSDAIPDLYKLVNDREWTMERMLEYMEVAAVDQNDDAKFDGDEDLVGLAVGDDPVHFLYNGAGLKFMSTDSAGYYEFLFNSPESIETMTSIFDDFMYSPYLRNTYLTPATVSFFKNNQALFAMGTVKSAIGYREMLSPYGILPVPMFDKSQNRYYSEVSPHHDSWMFVLNTVTDLDYLGDILETLNYYSYYNVYNTFYEVVVEGRGTRDQQSRDMLKIVFNNRIYDPGLIYDISGFPTIVLRYTKTGLSNFAHLYGEYEGKLEEDIEKINIKIDNSLHS